MQSAKQKIDNSSRIALIALVIAALWILAYGGSVLGKMVRVWRAEGFAQLVKANAGLLHQVVTQAFLLALTLLAATLFGKIRQAGTPFTPAVPRRMKTMALLIFLLMEVPNWVCYIARAALGISRGWTFIGNYGIIGLIFAAVLFSLAVIFEYGCLLQQENDETL